MCRGAAFAALANLLMVNLNTADPYRIAKRVDTETSSSGYVGACEAFPKIRRDLVTVEQKQGENSYYIIKDPLKFRYFKVGGEEMFVLDRLDGKNSLESIAAVCSRELGLSTEGETVKRFVKRLEMAGLLDGDQSSSAPVYRFASASDGRRISLLQKVLFVRIKVFNLDRLFNFLIRHLGFFFNRYFVTFALTSILVGSGLVIQQWGRFTSELNGILFLHYAPAFLATSLIIVALHEFAHGLTCKHFGGEVKEMGVLLIYLNLALYCNVSDAWLFAKRSSRLWVMFAGGLFETFLLSLAAVLWTILRPGNFWSVICLMVVGVSGVKTLFNFNPLIKLDGYYLLSDYLEMPNLREKAFNFVKNEIAGKLKRKEGGSKTVTRKERVVYWAYAALAVPFTGGLITMMIWKLANSLISKYHAAGAIILAAILLLLFGDVLMAAATRIGRLVGKSA
jgi:putative peptide zinc metalloprotease protein